MVAATDRKRDPRLDFFRGAALFIIYVAHTSYNWLWDYIPARYGFSDAADMFVFISGYAAAIAFGGTFLRAGFWVGAARILNRCWQLYLAHLGLLFAIIGICVTGEKWFGGNYVATLGLERLIAQPVEAIQEMFLLVYVPRYLDILPLYLVLLAMIPAAMLLARIARPAPLFVSMLLYESAQFVDIGFTADRGSGAKWLFNPFAWQLIFYTGFSISRGWAKPPPFTRGLAIPAAAFVLFAAWVKVTEGASGIGFMDAASHWAIALGDKRNIDPLRLLHFLCLAYLVVGLLKGREHWISGRWAEPILTLGRQGLGVFVTVSMASIASGILFEQVGTGLLAEIGVNVAAFLTFYGVARGLGWIKSQPWKIRHAPKDHKGEVERVERETPTVGS
jgi:hypothetical protein